MQSQEYARIYHEPTPSELPVEGWKRVEIRDMSDVYGLGKQLEAEMRRLVYSRKDTFAVSLVLREAAANALKHGNRGDKRRTVRILPRPRGGSDTRSCRRWIWFRSPHGTQSARS